MKVNAKSTSDSRYGPRVMVKGCPWITVTVTRGATGDVALREAGRVEDEPNAGGEPDTLSVGDSEGFEDGPPETETALGVELAGLTGADEPLATREDTLYGGGTTDAALLLIAETAGLLLTRGHVLAAQIMNKLAPLKLLHL